jgi:phosphatidylinositol-4,5-bisphosphate 4-phosphatase
MIIIPPQNLSNSSESFEIIDILGQPDDAHLGARKVTPIHNQEFQLDNSSTTAQRSSLYNALAKTYGEKNVADALQTYYMTPSSFLNDSEPLQEKNIVTITNDVKTAHFHTRKINERNLNFHLSNYMETSQHINSSKIREEALHRVRNHPLYHSGEISKEFIHGIMAKVQNDFLTASHEKFFEEHPGLYAQFGHQGYDLASWDNKIAYQIGNSNNLDAHQKDTLIKISSDLFILDSFLTKMSFDITTCESLIDSTNSAIEKLEHHKHRINQNFPEDSLIRKNFCMELDKQITTLNNRREFLVDYVKKDPLSDKSVAHNKTAWRKASLLALIELRNNVENRLNTGENEETEGHTKNLLKARQKLDESIILASKRVKEAENDEKHLNKSFPPSRTVSPKPTSRIFSKHPIEQQLDDEKAFFSEQVKNAKVLVTEEMESKLSRLRCDALDSAMPWNPIERKMVVTRDGLTRTYVSVIIPASKIGHGIGRSYQQENLEGVSAGNQVNPNHPRNSMISELYRLDFDPKTGKEVRVLISRTLRHGVLDPWKIENPTARKDASEKSAREVIETAIISNEPFLEKAKENYKNGSMIGSRIVHVNINLTTADDTLIRKTAADYREGDFTKNQFDAFDQQNGLKMFEIDGEKVPVDVETITFSFGVNGFALGKGIGGALPENSIWPPEIVEHNRNNLNKLIGTLSENTPTGGYIGSIVERLEKAARADGISQREVDKINSLILKIQTETDTVRNIFNTEIYKHGIDDAYKMSRHIMHLTQLGAKALLVLGDKSEAFTLSQGCKSNKDRGGMADVEHKAQLIIEDMGGHVVPNSQFSDEDRIIYNTVLTSSGQLENQEMNTGVPGSKNAKELRHRIVDLDALAYAMAFARFAKA